MLYKDDNLPTIQLPALVEGRESLWGKTRESFRYAWKHYADKADWFLKADDDSFIVMENLRYVLSGQDPDQPVHLGHKFQITNANLGVHQANDSAIKAGYMQGGSGYVLSREALKRFIDKGIDDPKICQQDPVGPEDLEMGIYLFVLKLDNWY